jgi:glycosyltransferase involved in cell wall biosynthesis
VRKPLTIFVPHCSGMLTDHLPYGDGLVAQGFIAHLARRGHQLHVAAQKVALREPLPPNVSVHELPCVSSRKISKRVEYMLRVRRLLSILRKSHRFDLIHQMNPVFTGISLALAGSGLPLVLGTYVARWPDDPDSLSAAGWSKRAIHAGRNAISFIQQWQADALLLTTPAAWNRMPHPRAVRDRAYFLPHGIDTEVFSPAPHSTPGIGSTDEPPSILFFANVLKRKGILTLIEAFPAVRREFPTAKLVVAGEGPALDEVKRRVAELGYGEHVAFLGRQERSSAPALYRSCSVYCFPSFGEPYGTTLVEAMSCGKPVVVTDSGGPAHLVSAKGGVFFPAGDSAALSRALCDLLRDPQRRAVMGHHNRQVVEATMSWEQVTQQLENIYEITLSRTRGSATRGNRRTAVSEVVGQAMDTGR